MACYHSSTLEKLLMLVEYADYDVQTTIKRYGSKSSETKAALAHFRNAWLTLTQFRKSHNTDFLTNN